jgi:hypothetical protein
MMERLFFNRIDAKATGASVGHQDNLPILAGPHEAKPALIVMQFAQSWAEVALNAAIVQDMPILRWHSRVR